MLKEKLSFIALNCLDSSFVFNIKINDKIYFDFQSSNG